MVDASGRSAPAGKATDPPMKAGGRPDHAVAIADQTFSGVMGISRCRIPHGDNASITALCTAAVDPMLPDSPIPLAPNGFLGVSVSMKLRS